MILNLTTFKVIHLQGCAWNLVLRFIFKLYIKKFVLGPASIVKSCLASNQLIMLFLFLILVLTEIYIRQRKMPRGKPKRKS